MDVKIRFFASYREATGLRETTADLRPGSTLGQLLEHLLGTYPGLRAHRESMLLAVNEEFSDPSTRLEAGDEVALLPPVSGGSSRRCWIQDEAIDAEAVLDLVRDPRAGALVLFLGT
ncbi:MAG: molybdopterin converting factor subunit 1, partial [Vicinamibacteria bacterium]